MGLFDFMKKRNKRNPDPTYEDERMVDRGPWNCPRCGSYIHEFAGVEFIEESPAPIREGWCIANVVPASTEQFDNGFEIITRPVPAMAILVKKGVPVDGSYVCLGLRDREDVETYLAPDFPGGKVPESCTSKPPCGWSGATSDYSSKWI